MAQKDTGKSKKTVGARAQDASAFPPGRTPDKTTSDSAPSSVDRSMDDGTKLPQIPRAPRRTTWPRRQGNRHSALMMEFQKIAMQSRTMLRRSMTR
ncbi:hypothetical protein CGLAMM_02385 [Acetobacteraceae bacterium EV16G]